MYQEHTVGGVSVVFTDTAHGNLAAHTGEDAARVQARRERLAREIGVTDITFVSQVHSARVLSADEASQETEADAIVSPLGTSALGILTADCLPVVLVASTRNAAGDHKIVATAVAHAGRRGLLGGILTNTIAALRKFPAPALEFAVQKFTAQNSIGSRDLDIHAWIGPAICAACYEVPQDMQNESDRLLPGIAATTSWGTPSLDLPGSAKRQLETQGVAVHMDAYVCTLEEERFYSYRRDKTHGRMAGVVWKS